MPVPYVDYGGSLMIRPPYLARGVGFYGFVLEADGGALQKLLDERLNIPAGGAVQFEPAGPFVLLAFNDLGKLSSLDQPDRDKGTFAERECAIWMPVVDRIHQRSFWFHPYIFVDSPYALALGREVYGFPKSLGWFSIPEDPRTVDALSMETILLPEYGPAMQAVRKELVRAERTGGLSEPVRVATDAVAFGAELVGALAPHEHALGKVELIVHSFMDLVERTVPMVFLKQFPTSSVPGTACYRAIVETEARATALHGFALLPGEWTVKITPAASHPIAAELGLAGNVVKSALQFWISFDMIVELGRNIWTAPQSDVAQLRPKKIAILGGGVGAMTTALQLTSEPNWGSKYDITVYQMGWRLGGKGASGRGENNRIEEHGLHIWMGFYENAFRLMRQVYEENKKNRAPGTPLREWSEAFREHDFVAVTDSSGAGKGVEWEIWPMHLPKVPGTPGDGEPMTLWTAFVRILGWIHETYRDSAFRQYSAKTSVHHTLLGELRTHFGRVVDILADVQTTATVELVVLLETAWRLASGLHPDPSRHSAAQHRHLASLIETFRNLWRKSVEPFFNASEVAAHRSFVLIDFGVSVAMGLLSGGYLLNPAMLDTLEDEFQDWLKGHGAHPMTYDIEQSAVIRGLYDLVFAYRDGDANRPSFEAGPALRSSLLILGSYKGSVFWKMQAGMGDVVFGPMYEVLRDRGVKFEFFHRVEALELSGAGTSVEGIRMGVQATLKNPAAGYNPLREVEGLACWPSQPCYEQLMEGEELQQGGYNLESFWTPWKNPQTRVLKAGTDFDEVVLAISIGALPYLFADDAKLPEAFRLMLEKVETVATQAIQLWVKQPLHELGWEYGDVVLDAYTTPINTWAVMNQLLARESWPAGKEVQGIHYFCGQMEGAIPDRNNANAPAEALAKLEKTCADFIAKNLEPLWPRVAEHGAGATIVDKYLRTNIDPTERYVMSVAGSTRYRLRANESGFSNVTLAGDWTNNGFNAGCVEAAAMSGIQAANAIAGKPLNDGINGPLARALTVSAAAAGG